MTVCPGLLPRMACVLYSTRACPPSRHIHTHPSPIDQTPRIAQTEHRGSVCECACVRVCRDDTPTVRSPCVTSRHVCRTGQHPQKAVTQHKHWWTAVSQHHNMKHEAHKGGRLFFSFMFFVVVVVSGNPIVMKIWNCVYSVSSKTKLKARREELNVLEEPKIGSLCEALNSAVFILSFDGNWILYWLSLNSIPSLFSHAELPNAAIKVQLIFENAISSLQDCISLWEWHWLKSVSSYSARLTWILLQRLIDNTQMGWIFGLINHLLRIINNSHFSNHTPPIMSRWGNNWTWQLFNFYDWKKYLHCQFEFRFNSDFNVRMESCFLNTALLRSLERVDAIVENMQLHGIPWPLSKSATFDVVLVTRNEHWRSQTCLDITWHKTNPEPSHMTVTWPSWTQKPTVMLWAGWGRWWGGGGVPRLLSWFCLTLGDSISNLQTPTVFPQQGNTDLYVIMRLQYRTTISHSNSWQNSLLIHCYFSSRNTL